MSFKLTFAFLFTAFVMYNTIYNNNNNNFSITLVKYPKKEITKKQFYKSIQRVRMGLKRSPVWHLATVAKADVNVTSRKSVPRLYSVRGLRNTGEYENDSPDDQRRTM